MRHAVRALIRLLAVGPDYGERYIPADAAAAQRSARGTVEASCEVRRAPGDKGMGVFAAEPIEPGRWVCRYMGEVVATSASQAAPLFDPLGLISVSTAGLREVEPSSDYLLELTPGLCIDGRHSEHFSRFVNHDEHGQPHATQTCMSRGLEVPARGLPCWPHSRRHGLGTHRQPLRARECRRAARRSVCCCGHCSGRGIDLRLWGGVLARIGQRAERGHRHSVSLVSLQVKFISMITYWQYWPWAAHVTRTPRR